MLEEDVRGFGVLLAPEVLQLFSEHPPQPEPLGAVIA
jgi:hypothetical protein